jgi:hypothetical protein
VEGLKWLMTWLNTFIRLGFWIRTRVCKNPKISETRPDPNSSGFLRCDLRNLKFYQVKPGPTLTRIFGFGFFLGFLGFRGLCCTHYQHTQRGVKKFRETFAAASTAKLHQHCCCYSAPVKAAAAHMKGFDRRAIAAAVLV